MERLTKRIGGNVYYTNGKYDETIPAECEPHDVRKILQALADYEDTNHTPEECTAAFTELDTLKRNPPVQVESSVLELAMECSKLKQELDAYRDAEPELSVEDIAYAYLEICEKDCAGDCTTGIPPCRFYNPPDVGLFGEPLPCGCELEDYCGYCSEAALKEQEGQK